MATFFFESIYIPECKPEAKTGRRLATVRGVVRRYSPGGDSVSRDGGGGLSILTKVLVGIKYNGTSSKLRTKKTCG